MDNKVVTGTSTREYIHHGLLHSLSYLWSEITGSTFIVCYKVVIKNTTDRNILHEGEFSSFRCNKNKILEEKIAVDRIEILEDVTDCMNKKYNKKREGLHLFSHPLNSGEMVIFNMILKTNIVDPKASDSVQIINNDQDCPIVPSVGTVTFNGHLMIRKRRQVTSINLDRPWSFKQFVIDGLIKITEYSKTVFQSTNVSKSIYLPGPYTRTGVSTHLDGYVNGHLETFRVDFSNNHFQYDKQFESRDDILIPASSYVSV